MRRKRRRRRQRLVAAITLTAVLALVAIAGGYWFGSWIVGAMSEGASWFGGGRSGTTVDDDKAGDDIGADETMESVEPTGFLVDDIEVAGNETLFIVQVGAYGDSQSAGRRAGELTAADYPAFVWQEGNLHRVVAGAFSSKEAADAFAQSLPGDTYVAVRSLPQDSERARLIWQEASYWSAAIENPSLNSSQLEHAWFRAQDAEDEKWREISDAHLHDLRRWWADPSPANFRHAMHSFLAIVFQ